MDNATWVSDMAGNAIPTRFGVGHSDWAGWGVLGAPSLFCFTGTPGVDRRQLSTVCEIIPAPTDDTTVTNAYTWFVFGGPVTLATRVVGNGGVDESIPYTAVAMMLNP
jgi:hypothetical protein